MMLEHDDRIVIEDVDIDQIATRHDDDKIVTRLDDDDKTATRLTNYDNVAMNKILGERDPLLNKERRTPIEIRNRYHMLYSDDGDDDDEADEVDADQDHDKNNTSDSDIDRRHRPNKRQRQRRRALLQQLAAAKMEALEIGDDVRDAAVNDLAIDANQIGICYSVWHLGSKHTGDLSKPQHDPQCTPQTSDTIDRDRRDVNRCDDGECCDSGCYYSVQDRSNSICITTNTTTTYNCNGPHSSRGSKVTCCSNVIRSQSSQCECQLQSSVGLLVVIALLSSNERVTQHELWLRGGEAGEVMSPSEESPAAKLIQRIRWARRAPRGACRARGTCPAPPSTCTGRPAYRPGDLGEVHSGLSQAQLTLVRGKAHAQGCQVARRGARPTTLAVPATHSTVVTSSSGWMPVRACDGVRRLGNPSALRAFGDPILCGGLPATGGGTVKTLPRTLVNSGV